MKSLKSIDPAKVRKWLAAIEAVRANLAVTYKTRFDMGEYDERLLGAQVALVAVLGQPTSLQLLISDCAEAISKIHEQHAKCSCAACQSRRSA